MRFDLPGVSGDELTEAEGEEEEEDLLDKAPGLTLTSRLACQAVVEEGDVVAEIPSQTIHIVQSEHGHHGKQ